MSLTRPRISAADIDRMTSAVFIEGPALSRPSTRYWVLLVLSAVIATAGVIADSVAVVIGAMIVAPLMTPILGVALGLVLADHRKLTRSVLLVLAGAAAVVAIGAVISVAFAPPDGYLSNTQVASRISPSLVDLLAALATGLVGAFALVRSDISDTIPGVAIAISLVPPLAVTGMLLQTGQFGDALQSLLLFGTNVAAIVATGTAILLLYQVRAVAAEHGVQVGALSRRTVAHVVSIVLLISIPLTVGTITITRDELLKATVTPLAQEWTDARGWLLSGVDVRSMDATITIIGNGDPPDGSSLRASLTDAGYGDASLQIIQLSGASQSCPPGTDTCREVAP